MGEHEVRIVDRVIILEETVGTLRERIAAEVTQWDSTTRLAVDTSVVAACGLLWGFTSLLQETSGPKEAEELVAVCVRQLRMAHLHPEVMKELESAMKAICRGFEEKRASEVADRG